MTRRYLLQLAIVAITGRRPIAETTWKSRLWTVPKRTMYAKVTITPEMSNADSMFGTPPIVAWMPIAKFEMLCRQPAHSARLDSIIG